MEIAFYAPMKPVDHPVPSGDRQIARLLIKALERAGHTISIASNLRSYDGEGNASFQKSLRNRAWKEAENYLKNNKPTLWFTYHLYHKSPDWIGPVVCQGLKIPYVVAEASIAPRQKGGKWDLNHKSVEAALRQCQRVYQLNPDDGPCVKKVIAKTSGPISLPPFVDSARYDRKNYEIETKKKSLARSLGLNPSLPWLVTAAMMRDGDKVKSYKILSKALKNINNKDFYILICGTGPAEAKTKDMFKAFPNCHFLGQLDQIDLRQILGACDLFVWPGVNEAFGLALLEAQAAGLPVVAGNRAGIANIIQSGQTGILTPVSDDQRFSHAIEYLLKNPEKRRKMGQYAQIHVRNNHDLETAAAIFRQTLPEYLP